MKFISLIEKASIILKIVLKSNKPSDGIISTYFRDNKYIGSKERKFLSESVYSSLRIWDLLNHLFELSKSKFDFLPNSIQTKTTPIIASNSEFAIKYLFSLIIFEKQFLNVNSYNPTHLLSNIFTNGQFDFLTYLHIYFYETDNLSEEDTDSLIELLNSELKTLHNSENLNEISILTSTPEWILNKLNSKYSFLELKSIFSKCNEPAKVCLRTNSMFTDRDLLTNELQKELINLSKGNLSPDCLILNERAKVDNTSSFKLGHFEFQDEGSQLISYAVSPKENWSILDSCAGAGGKSIHLAILQKDKGFITSTDLQYLKLKELNYRAQRCGLTSIKIQTLPKPEDTRKVLSNKTYDAVLVDAPCSGMGTIRRDPLRKYRLNEKLLQKLSANQYDILKTNSQFVKIGGILVYATCSLMMEENEMVVDKFLKANSNFEPDDLHAVFVNAGINISGMKEGDYSVSLRPDIHLTDGFFMARLIRNY